MPKKLLLLYICGGGADPSVKCRRRSAGSGCETMMVGCSRLTDCRRCVNSDKEKDAEERGAGGRLYEAAWERGGGGVGEKPGAGGVPFERL
jgi:hypothetical protein